MKINVLHIIKSLGRGGAEMLLPETLRIHNKDKFNFHYIYFLPWKDQMVETIRNLDGQVTCLEAKNNITLLSKNKEIINYINQHDIHIIHAHLPWAGFVARRVFAKTKIPLVYTEHNMQERYHIVTKTLNKFSFNYQSIGIGVSKDVSNSIKKNIHPKIPVKTILNGVNTDKFKDSEILKGDNIRAEFNIPKDALVVGLVAVFRFQKRIDVWLEVLKAAAEKNNNIYGLIVGAGPLEKEIYQKHKELGLEGRVFFAGLQTETRDYFNAMDIFMMTSSFEGLPIALLEAMSMELAIVSTDAGGIKEVIIDGEDGLLSSVEEYDKLSDYLIQLESDRQALKRLQSNARKRTIKAFSLQNMVDELEQIYIQYTYGDS